MKYKLIALALALIFGLEYVFAADDVDGIIEKVQKKYDRMDNFSASFKQVETFKLTGSQNELLGKIFIRQGVKYRFESDDQTVVTDGKTVWTYNDISKQVIIDRVRENSGALLPRDLLYKYPKNSYAALLGEERINGRDYYLIKLSPKENYPGYLKGIKLWVDKKELLVSRMETIDLNGNSAMIDITAVDGKTALPDELFVFQPQAGVDVVDMR
jgi:outer membrane lipoprotein carrier protein